MDHHHRRNRDGRDRLRVQGRDPGSLRRPGSRGIEALTCQPPTLEELFLSQYRDAIGTDEKVQEEVQEEVSA